MGKRKIAAGFRQRKDGKYESRFTINGKRYSVYADTLKECKEKDAELRKRIRNGSYIENRSITLDQYYNADGAYQLILLSFKMRKVI